jgi:universal stress protein E
MGLDLPPEATELCARQHREAMAGFLETHAIPTANVHLLEGAPHECLQQVALDRAADFLVMGAVSRRGLKKLFIGSTAERTLDRLPCDLVIIKPEGFEPPPGDGD